MSDNNQNPFKPKCPLCGETSSVNAVICGNCGAELHLENNQNGIRDSDALQDQPEPQISQSMDITSRYRQLRAVSELIQDISNVSTTCDLFQRTVKLLVVQLGYNNASIFQVVTPGELAVLVEHDCTIEDFQAARGYQVRANGQTLVSKTLVSQLVSVENDIDQRRLSIRHELQPENRSEISLPIFCDKAFVAILDIQHSDPQAFNQDTVWLFQMIANQIGCLLQKIGVIEEKQIAFQEISLLYQASQALSKASVPSEVLDILSMVLDKSAYQAGLFRVDRGGLHLHQSIGSNQTSWEEQTQSLPYPDSIPISNTALEQLIKPDERIIIFYIDDAEVDTSTEVPQVIFAVPAQCGCLEIAIIPGIVAGKIELLVILGAHRTNQLTRDGLEPYAKLLNMASIVLGKVSAAQRLEKRLAALQTLNTVSQAVSVSTDLKLLYQVVHREVTSIMGRVNFAIATYDSLNETITIPYMYDGQTIRSVDAFPLGEGLTSILIRTKKSLMFIEDTERRALEFGAKLVGKPAKSWLGVPLLVGGDVIGAIILQDIENEGRFDDDDQQLLETLAAQVAVAIHNALLLEATYRQAARQQLLYEITSKIRNSTTIPEILETTSREISLALGAKRATIELGIGEPSQNTPED